MQVFNFKEWDKPEQVPHSYHDNGSHMSLFYSSQQRSNLQSSHSWSSVLLVYCACCTGNENLLLLVWLPSADCSRVHDVVTTVDCLESILCQNSHISIVLYGQNNQTGKSFATNTLYKSSP